MFEDYFMQMLTAIAPQMVHPLSPILPYSFQHFGQYLTNKCFNAVFQCVNWSGFVCIDMSFNMAPQKKKPKGVKSHDLGGQLTGSERDIKCSPNSPLNKSIVMRYVWHVAPSYWNHTSCKPNSSILGKKKVGYYFMVAGR